MNGTRKITLWLLLALCSIVILGCGKKADENKPISEVKTEAEKMDTNKLRTMAMTYKKAISAKQGELEKLAAKLKEIPAAELLGNEAKELKTDIENLNKSVSALTERFNIYFEKLKEKGGDVSDLQI
jgi:archaellum component FlaC